VYNDIQFCNFGIFCNGQSEYQIISNNNISGNIIGIASSNTSNNQIIHNNLFLNGYAIIIGEFSDYSNVSYNNLSYNMKSGIKIGNNSLELKIQNNNLTNCGITLGGSQISSFENNTMNKEPIYYFHDKNDMQNLQFYEHQWLNL